MSQPSHNFRRRQAFSMAMMIVFIAACVTAGFYFRSHPLTAEAQKTVRVEQTEASLDTDVEDALARLSSRKADVRTSAASNTAQKAEIVFEGVTDPETMQSVLDLLKQYGMTATFFFSGSEAESQPESLQLVSKAGMAIGANCESTVVNWNQMNERETIELLCRASMQMELSIGLRPTSLLYKQGNPDEMLLGAANACYLSEVVVPTSYINAQSFTTEDEARAYIDNLERDAILCVRLALSRPQLLSIVEWSVSALGESDLTTRAKAMIEANAGQQVEPFSRIYTSEKAVAYTFSGMGNDLELISLLSALDALSAQCTFFVTADEMTQYHDMLQTIQSRGHDLGVAINASGLDAEQALEALLLAQEKLKQEFGCENVTLARTAYGSISAALREAASAGGFTLLTQMYNMVQSGDARATDAQAVYNGIFGSDTTKLQRGAILHFQMNQFTQSHSLLGELAVLVDNQRNLYDLRSVVAMATNQNLTYSYPLAENQILPTVYNRIHSGQLSGSVLQAIQQGYIGANWVNTTSMLPGFTAAEIKTLDKTGFIKNTQNMVFLTFDDWGTDASIEALLEVLSKHNAKATFFVRTENVKYNPNLLRAIAMEGHAIASHTHTHMKLATDKNGNGRSFVSLSDAEAAALCDDLVQSYQVLQSIVGDIIVDGKPALTPFFRPPTQAVSKIGLQTVFDCGFKYSISGSYSAEDYKASDAQKLASNLSTNTVSGGVIVMHMSDNSLYTAEALDAYLTKMELRTVKNQFKFVRLDEALSTY